MSTQDFATGFADGPTTSFSTGWGETTTTGGGTSKGFTIKRSAVGGAGIRADRISLERIVRFAESPRIQAIRARRKALEESEDDSELIWGQPSEYGSDTKTPEEDRRGFTIVNPRPQAKNTDTNKPIRVYTEVNRITETVRVTNPSDATQYVDVQRIKSITFRGPDDVDVRFDLKPPAGTPVP